MDTTRLLIEWVARGVEIAAAILIAVAAIRSFVRSVWLYVRRVTPDDTVSIRHNLGRWLALALEFTLAADIVRTAVTPTWDDIAKLAAIAAIRTALNYFLSLEERREPALQDAKRRTGDMPVPEGTPV